MTRILIIVGAVVFWVGILAFVLWLGAGRDRYVATRRRGGPGRPYHSDRAAFEQTGTFHLPERVATPGRRPETLADIPKHSVETMGGETTQLAQFLPPSARARVEPHDDLS